mmetsp:Transcript_76762/g.220437  ORF Transcript_76762/g.220437 Transcript_76762/m.220437 type:complete len:307 (-) Transcript_76762:50-970(-)
MCAGVSLSEQVVRPARATLSSVPKAAMAEEVAGVVTEAVEEVEASTGSDADVKVPVEVDAEAEVGFDWPAWSSVMIMMRLSSRSKLACSVFSLFSLPGIYSISSVPSLFSLFSLSWLSSCAAEGAKVNAGVDWRPGPGSGGMLPVSVSISLSSDEHEAELDGEAGREPSRRSLVSASMGGDPVRGGVATSCFTILPSRSAPNLCRFLGGSWRSSCDDMSETGVSDATVVATAAVVVAAAALGETGGALSSGHSVEASASKVSMAGGRVDGVALRSRLGFKTFCGKGKGRPSGTLLPPSGSGLPSDD